MKAWLVTNHFLQTNKFHEIYTWLKEAAGKHGIEIEERTNAELLGQLEITNLSKSRCLSKTERPDFVIFWDKDVRLAKLLEKAGLRLFNSADGVAVCDDKSLTHERLLGTGIRMPKTFFAPLTFPACGYPDLSFLLPVEKELGFPMVMKECFGSFGAQVYLVHSHEELVQRVLACVGTPFLMQELIQESMGRDIRINMVGDRAVATMERYNEHDFRANITNGGSMRRYEPTEEELQMARQVMKELQLDFAGVDIMFGKDGPVLCEVNSNAHFKNIYDCTGVNVADAIMEYIVGQL